MSPSDTEVITGVLFILCLKDFGGPIRDQRLTRGWTNQRKKRRTALCRVYLLLWNMFSVWVVSSLLVQLGHRTDLHHSCQNIIHCWKKSSMCFFHCWNVTRYIYSFTFHLYASLCFYSTTTKREMYFSIQYIYLTALVTDQDFPY